ncbi:type IV pilus assembly PilZ [Methylobacterium sp. 4-46]|uniref:PilZ domain-containing protein n=1 Tax=unclassified Methylobacterium TaxID=2615210 RepID=UPI000152C33A|nr:MULTISPECIES: PilZ domain-containing protein [Methylobacterium]ACA20758.1 type IV pilus assembly PilZ [Methylobacterium sp. 4-46]WFT79909.1 PilZ domain-containing protein [Methylobacterium nodulans]
MDDAKEHSAGRNRDPGAGRRHRVLQQGRIVLGSDQLVPCTVRDLSRSGAKIRIDRAVALPERFALYIAGHNLRSVTVVLRWRRGDFAGLAFLSDPRGSVSDPRGSVSDPRGSEADPRGSGADPGGSSRIRGGSAPDPSGARRDPADQPTKL